MKSRSHIMFFPRQQQGRAHWCQSQPQAPLQVTCRMCAMSNTSLCPVRCAWTWRAVALLRLLACLALAGIEPWAVRHWVPSSGCVLLEGRSTGTYHFNFPCHSGIWWDNPLILWFSLWGLFPNIFHVYKMSPLWQVVQLHRNASTKEGLSQDCPLPWLLHWHRL